MTGSRKAAEIIASMGDFPVNYGGTINALALIIERETAALEMGAELTKVYNYGGLPDATKQRIGAILTKAGLMEG